MLCPLAFLWNLLPRSERVSPCAGHSLRTAQTHDVVHAWGWQGDGGHHTLGGASWTPVPGQVVLSTTGGKALGPPLALPHARRC